MSENYIAGSCNIGKKEKRKRLIIGILGTIVSIHLSLYFIISTYYWTLLIWLFVAVFYSTLCLVQAFNKFCVYFAYKHLFNFGELNGKKNEIENIDFIKQDIKKAQKLILLSFIISLLWCVLIYNLS